MNARRSLIVLVALTLLGSCKTPSNTMSPSGDVVRDADVIENLDTKVSVDTRSGQDSSESETDVGGVQPATTAVVTYTTTDEVFSNPERGFYSYVEVVSGRDFSWVVDRQHTLVYSYIRLDDYRDTDIPQSLLDDAAAGLDVLRSAGIKAILRFAYNFGPYPNSDPDASKAQVLEHIDQIAPFIAANEDVVALVQAGFIGAWGEWHTSTHGLLDEPQDRKDIIEALLQAIPASRMTQIRYPAYKFEMYGEPLSAGEAHGNTFAARIGHHNDCFLASDSDQGTYPSGEAERWKAYLADDTRYVVMGGETCNHNPPRSDCATALEEMERLHFSFINQDYEPNVIASWQNQGCYNTMARRLGYRFELMNATWPTPSGVRPGGHFPLRLELTNSGFAALFNPRPVVLVLETADNARHELVLSHVDPRSWTPGTTSTIDIMLELGADLPQGPARLSLWLPDASTALAPRPEFAVRFANEGVWENSLNVLGTFELNERAEGSANPNARALTLR